MFGHQLLIVLVLLPLAGAVPAALARGRASAWIALGTSILVFGMSGAVLYFTLVNGPQTYRVGGWAPPYGIVLVADTFSAMLALTTAAVAVASALHTLAAGEPVLDRHLY